MEFDYGPLQTYEITWKSGHVERIKAHQVTWPVDDMLKAIDSMFGTKTRTERDPRIKFHAELNGRWQLILSALEADIRTVRNCVTEEMDAASWVTESGEAE